MAINPQNLEKSDQMKWGSELQGSGQVRSYTCAFCQRGFSNAQALGGHMNIHRRDRAKLKQAADENSLPPESTLNPAHQEPRVLEEKFLFQLESREEKSCSPKKPCSLNLEDDNRDEIGLEERHQLPLFFERPSAQKAGGCAGGNEEKGIPAPSQVTAGLDLELRLGPEPQETREYF
ncbi:uncharacterized protein LOC133873858 [Alnus glutinosa]|uniref:uncharacterized protein LOC133873858 n=1 Tax=Alnus glutinosa TaxID=3517 RepID=UPI002D77DB35|nr:uncharacterized protein LOC133873858 [Alnus glutinosa]